jgi:hypothetical protein
MHHGVVFRQVLAMGPLAESLGYDSVWVMDHLLNCGYIREAGGPALHPLATLYLSGGPPLAGRPRGARPARRGRAPRAFAGAIWPVCITSPPPALPAD